MKQSLLNKKLKAALRRYNCEDWDANIRTAEYLSDVEVGNVSIPAGGQCNVLYRYHRATVEISATLQEDHIDYVVQHEAAHILLGEMSSVFDRLLQFVPDKHRDAVQEIFTDAEEHTCDRLARSVIHKEKQ